MTKKEINETIFENAMIGAGEKDCKFFPLRNARGEQAGLIYQSEIEPYPWMMTRGVGIIDSDPKSREALAARNGVLIFELE